MLSLRRFSIAAASIISVALLAGFARSALAGQVLINFDDLATTPTSGVRLSTQYQSKGIVFGLQPGMPATTAVVMQMPAGTTKAHSGRNAARIPEACGVEVYRNDAWAQFVSPTQSVGMFAENIGGGTVPITIDAVSTTGQVLSSNVFQVGGSWQQLSVSHGSADIAFIHIYGPISQGCTFIDDVSFGTSGASSGADFGVFFGGLDVGAAPGNAGTGYIGLTRFGGSNGRIQFSASGLPVGVSASFSPQPATGSSLQSDVVLTINVSSNAPPVTDIPITITGTPLDASAGSAPRSVVIPLTVAGNYSVVAQSIEVTQGVQGLTIPNRVPYNPALGTLAQPLPYGGVLLSAGHKTIARVFVEGVGISTATTPNVALYGYNSNGQLLPGMNPILPDNTGSAPGFANTTTYDVSYAQRVDTSGLPWEFTLPDAWTQGTITLRAVAVPQVQQSFDTPTDAACSTPTCLQLEEVAVSGISFHQSIAIGIAPLIANMTGYLPGPPDVAYASAMNVLPLDITVFPYVDDIEMIDIYNDGKSRTDKASEALGRVVDWDNNHNNHHFGQYTVGIISGIPADSDIGMSDANDDNGDMTISRGRSHSVVNQTRYLTSVAHEFGHSLGRKHASSDCGADPSNGPFESWPVDESVDNGDSGDMDSIGIDVSSQAPRTIKANTNGVASTPVWHDFMSYCAGAFLQGSIAVDSAQVWISAKGWQEIMGTNLSMAPEPPAYDVVALLDPFAVDDVSSRGLARAHNGNGTPPSRSGVRGAVGLMVVHGYVYQGRAVITHVGPAPEGVSQEVGASSSAIRVRFTGAVGQALSETPMVTAQLHVDPGTQRGSAQGVTTFYAVVPGGAASQVQIVQSGKVVASRLRPLHPPTVNILNPRESVTIGVTAASSNAMNAHPRRGGAAGSPRAAGRTLITWASHGEGAESSVSIDMSVDGGASWREIYSGPDKGRANVPSLLFADSAPGHARIRVRINDGFNETAVASGALTTTGGAPYVRIFEPANGRRFRHDALIYLKGTGFDNAPSPLTAKSLTWLVDGRVVGEGPRASVSILRPGPHKIELRARDGRGRISTANVSITSLPVKPMFVQLKPPASLLTTVELVRLSASTTIPATLFVAGKHFSLTRQPQQLEVPVRPGNGPAMIVMRLEANGMTNVSTLVIRRLPPGATPPPLTHPMEPVRTRPTGN